VNRETDIPDQNSQLSRPLVSVCIITFNQEEFVHEAIEGVLKQETTFPIELIIGEDCSTDRTREICEDYQKKYPRLIRVIAADKNMGATRNFLAVHEASSGKYIAVCEGDDYWTDPKKLQKQVGFLEVNNKYSICSHNAHRYFQEDNEFVHLEREDRDLVIKDFVVKNSLGFASCSLLYRNEELI